MNVLKIEYDSSKYYPLTYGYNKRFDVFLREVIRPNGFRRFDPKRKCWAVHESKLPSVIAAGKRYFDHVDYSSLPLNIQISLVQKMEDARWTYEEDFNFPNRGPNGSPNKSSSDPYRDFPETPRSILCVTQEAPWEVIKASYKALALKHHPDVGGDIEEFKRIQAAYEKLEKEMSGKS